MDRILNNKAVKIRFFIAIKLMIVLAVLLILLYYFGLFDLLKTFRKS